MNSYSLPAELPGSPNNDSSNLPRQGDLSNAPSQSKNHEHHKQYLGIHLGVEEFYLPISTVREVALVPSIAYVPNANPYIDGIASLRGHLIPVINIKKLMGFSLRQRTSKERLMVLEHGSAYFALIVDSISNVITIKADEIDTHLPPLGSSVSIVTRISIRGDKNLGILDTARILTLIQGKTSSN